MDEPTVCELTGSVLAERGHRTDAHQCDEGEEERVLDEEAPRSDLALVASSGAKKRMATAKALMEPRLALDSVVQFGTQHVFAEPKRPDGLLRSGDHRRSVRRRRVGLHVAPEPADDRAISMAWVAHSSSLNCLSRPWNDTGYASLCPHNAHAFA